jgi:hypothetical protein
MQRAVHRAIRAPLFVAAVLGLTAAAVQADVTAGSVVTAAEKENIRGLIPNEMYP